MPIILGVNSSSWGPSYWPVFLIISSSWIAAGFGIPEAIALITQPGTHLDNTLSYYARSELHVSVATMGTVHTVAWWMSFVLWMIFVVFITAHIWFDQFG